MWKGFLGGKWALRKDDRTRRRRPTSPPQQHCYRQADDREEDGFVLVGETAVERSTVRASTNTRTSNSHLDEPPSYESLIPRTSYDPLTSYTPFFSSLNMGQKNSNLVTTEISPDYVISTTSAASSSSPIVNLSQGEPAEDVSTDSQPALPSNSSPSSTTFASTLPGEVMEEDTFLLTPRVPPAVWNSTDSPLKDVPFKLASWLEYGYMNSDFSAYDSFGLPNLNIADFQYDFSLERGAVRDAQLQ